MSLASHNRPAESPTAAGGAAEESVERVREQLLGGAADLARSAKHLFFARSLLLWLSGLLIVFGICLVADMLLRREETGLRVLALLTWLGLTAYMAFRWLAPAWHFSPTPLQVAKWIEDRRPEYRDRLAVAVELASLQPDDERYGSHGFRDSAMRVWMDEKLAVNWRQFLDLTALRRTASLFAGALIMLVGLFLLWPAESLLATQRLMLPWSSGSWPKADQLRLNNPPRVVARGSELQLEAVDARPPLPNAIDFQVRPAAGSALQSNSSVGITTLRATIVGDVAIGNLPLIEEAIEVRAVGGDDHEMQWHRIDAVAPPTLESFHFTITPPGYSQQPSNELVGKRIRVLSGSQITFEGRFSEPIASVTLLDPSNGQPSTAESIEGSDGPADEQRAEDATLPPTDGQLSQRPQAFLDRDKRTLQIANASGQPLTIQNSLQWQLSIETVAGLKLLQPDHWAVEVVPDTPPTVTLQAPELDALTSAATLDLVGKAVDDMGLTQISARLSLIDAADLRPREHVLWTSQPTELSAGARELPIAATWDIGDELPLTPGQRVIVWLEARDTLGQIGRSTEQSFEIRDSSDLLAAIEKRRNNILQRMQELVDAQRRNQQTTVRTTELLRQEDQVRPSRAAELQKGARTQRSIAATLNGRADSIASEIAKSLQMLSQNELEQSTVADEWRQLDEEVARLTSDQVEPAVATADRAAVGVQQAADEGRAFDDRQADMLSASGAAQAEALRGMQALLDRLSRHESLQQLQYELSQIIAQQSGLRRETDQLQLDRLAEPNSEQVRARTTALASNQLGLARRLDEVVQRARQLHAEATEDQQAFKQQIARAADSLTSGQASSKMRQSTSEIRSDRFAAASGTQQQVSELLSEALRQLGGQDRNQPGSQLENRAADMRRTSQALAELAERQAALAQSMQTANNAAELSRSQSELQQETAQQAEQARSAGDGRVASDIDSAARAQATAAENMERGLRRSATGAAESAAEQLQRTAEQLQGRAADLEQQVKQQQIFQLAEAITELATRQSPVVTQFQSLAAAAANPPAEDDWQSQIRQSASQQEVVRQAVRDVRQQTTQLPTFDWTLELAEAAMGRAVALAERYRMEPDARTAAEDALRLLELAAAAVEPTAQADRPQEPTDNPATSNPPPAEESTRPERPLPATASLKLLRGLQLEVNRQTRAVQELPPPNRARQLSELAHMQQQLSEQVAALMREIAATPVEKEP